MVPENASRIKMVRATNKDGDGPGFIHLRLSAMIRRERFSALFHRARGEGSSFTQVYGSNKMAAMGAKGIELVQRGVNDHLSRTTIKNKR